MKERIKISIGFHMYTKKRGETIKIKNKRYRILEEEETEGSYILTLERH